MSNSEFWKSKRVLVTGAAGFIGGHLTHKLLEMGAEVTAFIRYTSRGSQGSLSTLPNELRSGLRIISGDIRDPAAVTNAVRNQNVIFHLAALIGIPYSYVHPIEYVQTNVLATTYLLEAARNHEIEKFVNFSTSEVYGTALYVPIDENHTLQGQSPYSASKIAADQLALSFFRTFDLPVAIARPFNTYGPRQPARAVIPTIISQALRGGDVKIGALSPTRDLTFVEDTVDGVLCIGESDKSVGEVINIGSSKEISIGDLANKLFELLGEQPKIICDEQRLRPSKSEVERLLASTQKAQELLGWKPQTSLEQGLMSTIEWIRSNMDFFEVDNYHV